MERLLWHYLLSFRGRVHRPDVQATFEQLRSRFFNTKGAKAHQGCTKGSCRGQALRAFFAVFRAKRSLPRGENRLARLRAIKQGWAGAGTRPAPPQAFPSRRPEARRPAATRVVRSLAVPATPAARASPRSVAPGAARGTARRAANGPTAARPQVEAKALPSHFRTPVLAQDRAQDRRTAAAPRAGQVRPAKPEPVRARRPAVAAPTANAPFDPMAPPHRGQAPHPPPSRPSRMTPSRTTNRP